MVHLPLEKRCIPLAASNTSVFYTSAFTAFPMSLHQRRLVSTWISPHWNPSTPLSGWSALSQPFSILPCLTPLPSAGLYLFRLYFAVFHDATSKDSLSEFVSFLYLKQSLARSLLLCAVSLRQFKIYTHPFNARDNRCICIMTVPSHRRNITRVIAVWGKTSENKI